MFVSVSSFGEKFIVQCKKILSDFQGPNIILLQCMCLVVIINVIYVTKRNFMGKLSVITPSIN